MTTHATQTMTFSPLDYGFRWTAPTDQDPMGWYEYDGKPAEQAALKARNAEAKRMQKLGYEVRKVSLGKQLMTRGGIGSGHPHIDILAPVYALVVVVTD